MALTTVTRVKSLAGITASTWDTILGTLLTECSAAVETYCGRTFEATEYREWYDGPGTRDLVLRQYPVSALYSVSFSVANVGDIRYTGAATYATVSFDGTNLVLRSVLAGTATTTTLAVATYKSVSTLLTAVDGTAGWDVSTYRTDLQNHPSATIRPFHGAWASSSIRVAIDVPEWSETLRFALVGERSVRLDVVDLFPAGINNVFAWYTAGYTLPTEAVAGTVPAGLMYATEMIILDAFNRSKRDFTLQSESLADYSWTAATTQNVDSCVQANAALLSAYRRLSP